jgi:transcriptional regulator with XRE-family HTH domain
MTLERLADLVEVTPQQIQKYERGLNRISASKLHQLAFALGVPAAYFYDGLPVPTPVSSDEEAEIVAFLSAGDALSLAAAINRVRSSAARAGLLRLIEAIGHDEARREADRPTPA